MVTIPSLPHLRLTAHFRAEEPARLPGYKGSLLRGAFGHALRRAVCAMGPEQPCSTCPLRRTCVHPRLLETLIDGEPPPFLRGLRTAPRPYVFEPEDDAGRRDFAAGDLLRTDLVLFGQAAELQAYAVLALSRMAERGLGTRHKRFALTSIDAHGPAGVVHWEAGQPRGEVAALVIDPPPLPSNERVTLRFFTPTRIKIGGELIDRFTFRQLAFRMLRRVLELAFFHLPGAAIDWEIQPLLRRANAVAVVASELRWHDWERYSNRQKTSMQLGGFVGTVVLEGELEPFAELLRLAEVVHVGKGTTFGLGRMRVE